MTPEPSVRFSTLATNSDSNLVVDIAATDINSDGLLDLLVSRISSNYFHYRMLEAYINNGDETFSNRTDFYLSAVNEFQASANFDSEYSGTWIEKLYLMDINADGRMDIVPHHDNVSLQEYELAAGPYRRAEELEILPPLLAQADGSFEPMDWNDLPAIGLLVPLDADADGDIDLLVHRYVVQEDNTVEFSWALQCNNLDETGTFSYRLCGSEITLAELDNRPRVIYSPTVMDANSDGYLDVVYGGSLIKNGSWIDIPAALVTVLNDGAGNFSEDLSVLVKKPERVHIREMGASDLNGDTLDDLVISAHGFDDGGLKGEFNAFMLADASTGVLDGSSGDKTPFEYRGFTHSSDMADVDNDGDIDIVMADITGADTQDRDLIYVLINDGNANFTTVGIPFKPSENDIPFVVSTKLVDLNADNYVDLVLGGDDSRHPMIIIWNTGDGTFSSSP